MTRTELLYHIKAENLTGYSFGGEPDMPDTLVLTDRYGDWSVYMTDENGECFLPTAKEYESEGEAVISFLFRLRRLNELRKLQRTI